MDLQHASIFKGVDELYIDDFLSNCSIKTIKKGEFLFKQEDIGDSMYLVKTGRLSITVNSQEVTISEKGAIIGELCVFGQKKRSASVFALEDSQLIHISGEDFRIRIYSKDLDALLICYNIAKELSNRLIHADSLLN